MIMVYRSVLVSLLTILLSSVANAQEKLVLQAANNEMMVLSSGDLLALRSPFLNYIAAELAKPQVERDMAFDEVTTLPISSLEPLRYILNDSQGVLGSAQLVREVIELMSFLIVDTTVSRGTIYRLIEHNFQYMCQLYAAGVFAYDLIGALAKPIHKMLMRHTPYLLDQQLNRHAEQSASHLVGIHRSSINKIACSPNQKLIATAAEDHSTVMWRLSPGRGWMFVQRLGSVDAYNHQETQGHVLGVTAVTFAPDGLTLATGSHDHRICLWRYMSDERRWRLQHILGGEPLNRDQAVGHVAPVTALVFTPDGTTLCSGAQDGVLDIWQYDATTSSWRLAQQLGDTHNRNPEQEGHLRSIEDLAMSSDGRHLYSASNDHRLGIWQLNNRQRWQLEQYLGEYDNTDPLRGHRSGLTAVKALADDKTLITTALDGTLLVWRKSNGTWLIHQQIGVAQGARRGHTRAINALAVTRDGTSIVTASNDQTMIEWRYNPLKDQWEFAQQVAFPAVEENRYGHRAVEAVAVTADGRYLIASAPRKKLNVWKRQSLTDACPPQHDENEPPIKESELKKT